MKFDSVNYLISKFANHFLTTITLSFYFEKESADKLKEILNQKRDDYKIKLDLFYNIFEYENKYILKISIIHFNEETEEEIKNSIEEILSLNRVFSIMYLGKYNYYSFLCDLILRDII